MNELVDVKEIFIKFKQWWGSSLGIIVAFIFGIMIGMLVVEWRISNDCKFLNAFRFDSQSFTCNRKI